MSVASILEAMAANAGTRQLARGALIGNTISNVAAVPGQIMADRERQQIVDQENARRNATDARQARGDARDEAAFQADQRKRAVAMEITKAYTGGTPNDPTTNNLEAGIAKARELGAYDQIQPLRELHQKEVDQANPKPYQTDPTHDTRDARTNQIITPAVAKMPEMGTPAYEVATRVQDLLHPAVPPAGAPGGSVDYTALTTPAPADHAGDPSWTRADGTPKGNGFLGVLTRPDGKVSSEISIGVMINGKETEVPTLVPTLTAAEKSWLLTHDISDPTTIPMPIQQKAIDFAKTRIAAGKSPFAGPEDGPPTTPAAAGLTPTAATLQAYADQRAATKPPVDAHSPIYKEWQDYAGQGGKLGFDAYMTADANRKRPVVNVNGTGPTGGLDPDAVAYTATQYRVLGPQGIPTRIGEIDKAHILNEAAKQAKALGQSPAQAIQKQYAFKSDAAALTKMTTMASSAEAFETKAIAQADLVRSLSAKVSRADWPLINGALISGKEMTGDTDTHLFANGLLTFTTEYAKLMEGSTGSAAGSSEGARRDAAKLISTALKNDTIQKTLDQMQWEMRQTRIGYDVVKEHITTRMGGAPAAAPAAAAPSGNTYHLVNGQWVKQ